MMKRPLLILALLLMYCARDARAQEAPEALRPVFAAYTAEAGTAHLADTYLTPLKYSGWHAGLDYVRYQAMRFNPDRWVMSLHGNLGLDRTHNPAGNATMWGAMLRLDWSMMHKWRPVRGLTLALGGATGIEGGCLYTARNGNNPASARGAWTLSVTGYAAWQVKLWRLPVTLMYQPAMPLTGVFFAPQYGELYYEIYLGDRHGLVHGAWPGNRFGLDNRLTADLHLGATNLRIGYTGHILTSEVNHIVTRTFTHAFSIGVSGEWLSFNPRKGLPKTDARTASAIY